MNPSEIVASSALVKHSFGFHGVKISRGKQDFTDKRKITQKLHGEP
jgi:hypothetical protein